MAWSEHIHIHIHNEESKEIVSLLKEIKELLKKEDNDEKLRQQIMDKLNKLLIDIKSTI